MTADHTDKSENWKRAYLDCVQDACENCPFASIGGLTQRTAMAVPKYIRPEDAEEYLNGYRQAALEQYGPGWETCTFSWGPAIIIKGREP